MEVVAYANDLAILVTRTFLLVINKLMDDALGEVCSLVARCRLAQIQPKRR